MFVSGPKSQIMYVFGRVVDYIAPVTQRYVDDHNMLCYYSISIK